MEINPKFIYFDLDDTLLDHRQAEQHALCDIFEHFDLFASSDVEELVEVYHQVNIEQWALYSRNEVSRNQLQRNRFELTLRQLGLDDSNYGEVGAQYMQCYQNHWQWKPGAEAAFRAITDVYPVGILTNGFAETQKKKFKQFNFYNQVKHLVISEEVGNLKPHPSIFEHATALTGYQPNEILYVGDSYRSDVVGGTRFGWNVAWFTQNGEGEKYRKADYVFNDFEDLCNYLKV